MGGDLINIAICTNENYTMSESIGVLKEQTRSLNVRDYNNVNYNPALSDKNITIYHDSDLDKYKSFREYLKDFYDKNEITGRFNIDTKSDRNATKVLSSFVVSGTSDFYKTFDNRNDIVDYFKESYEFLKEENPTFYWLDVMIHFDEKGLPHMHASGLPLYEDEKGNRSFNVSKCQRVKNDNIKSDFKKSQLYYKQFQDRFFERMREKYPEKDLQRTDPNRDHDKKMKVKEYKEFKELQREFREKKEYLLEKNEQLKDIEKQMNNREIELEKYNNYFDKVDDYCNKQGLTLFQYQKELFYAERGQADYPSPEKYNPERELEQEREKEQERTLEHER